MTIKHLFPVAKPTLDLNFAAERSLDPSITFTRASIGTYVDANGVIQTAASDEPRFDHDPVTGASLGLLIEESRVNSITQSQALDTAPWFPINGAIASSPELSPEGAANAYRLTASASNCYNRYIITSSGSSYTFSAFIKAGNVNWARLYAFGGYVDFDLQNAVPGFVSAAITDYGVDSLDNGWVRCWAVTANTAVTQVRISPLIDNNDASTSPGDYIDIYGVQLEQGNFPTSYIPTAGSAVTRAVDTASITGTNFSSWYNQSEGTVFAELVNMASSGANSVWSFDDNTSSQRIMYRVNKGFVMTGYTTISDNENPVTAKFAYGIKANDYGGAKDGSILTAGTPGSVLPTVDRLNLGTGPGLAHSSGHIVRLAYYPRRLSDEQLKALTA